MPADSLDALDEMANRRRRHRTVPPPKRPALTPTDQTTSPPEPPPTASRTAPGGEPPAAKPTRRNPDVDTRTDSATPDPATTTTTVAAGSPTGPRKRITWTPQANTARLALVSYAAAARKLAAREHTVREAASAVPHEDLAEIIHVAAHQVGADPVLLARVSGLTTEQP